MSSPSGWRLIVAEKPSVARDIARVLGIRGGGKGVIGSGAQRVSWCLGHLVELEEPGAYDEAWRSWRLESLPMLPSSFRLKPRRDSEDQWRVLRDLLRGRGLAEVVNACDAGREGELIFAYAYELSGCRAPVQRLWISSMTDGAIRAGFQSLRPGRDFRHLAEAARCRSEADWLVGLNATRAMTTRMRAGGVGQGGLLSVGRVQTPTLALLDSREAAIEDFVPQDFWEVRVRFVAATEDPQLAGQEWAASWTGMDPGPDGKPEKPDKRIWDRARAQAVLERIEGREGLVERVTRKEVRERAPLLYDLTTLQKEANYRWKFSAQKTLDLAQGLYERHKVLTYPRTDSRHLGTDQEPGLPALLRALSFGPYRQVAAGILARWPIALGRRVIDDSEVSDHHAIIPTGVDPRSLGLSPEEKRIFDLVARRFLAVFMPAAVFAAVTIDTVIRSPGQEDHFIARGRSCLDPGWQLVDPPRKKRKERLLPALARGIRAALREAGLHRGQTQPPRRYSEASLLSAMENAGRELEDAELKRAMKRNGLGTPATRAAIIETLLRRQFIRREGGQLVPTPQGRALLAALPVDALRSPELTGRWEARLVAMAEGRERREVFMADIRAFTTELVEQIRRAPVSRELVLMGAAAAARGDVLSDCPRCEGQVRGARRGWVCPGCGLSIPGKIARREVSPRMAKALLSRGRTPVLKGFKSRANKPFAAALVLDVASGEVRFDFPEPEPLGSCPACGAAVRRRGRVYTCATGRECRFVIFEEMSGAIIDEQQVRILLRDGRSGLIEGFTDREGEPFSGVLRWTGERVQAVKIDPRELEPAAGTCPRCGAEVGFCRGRWRCRSCAFDLPGRIAGRDLRRRDITALLTEGRSPRLHGFRQRGGAVFKAALVLDASSGGLSFDYSKPAAEGPRQLPPGAPPPAFGEPVDCPLCIHRASPEPGYVLRGRSAWGCSEWRSGCELRIPFRIAGRGLTDEEIRRLFGKHKATRYLKGFLTPEGRPRKTCRVVLRPGEQPCWVLEERGGAKPR